MSEHTVDREALWVLEQMQAYRREQAGAGSRGQQAGPETDLDVLLDLLARCDRVAYGCVVLSPSQAGLLFDEVLRLRGQIATWRSLRGVGQPAPAVAVAGPVNVAADPHDPGGFRAEDFGIDGEVHVARFSGPLARQRAEAYAAWLRSKGREG